MSEERQQDEAGDEPKQQGESKSDEQRDAEEKFSQGGQDVEEGQHAEPESEG